MTRRRSVTALAMAVLGLLAVTSVAEAATKTAFAGPPLDKPPAGAPRGLDLNEFYRRQITIHVGDTVAEDIAGAAAAGIRALHLDRSGGGDISSLSEVAGAVSGG